MNPYDPPHFAAQDEDSRKPAQDPAGTLYPLRVLAPVLALAFLAWFAFSANPLVGLLAVVNGLATVLAESRT